MIYTPRFQSRIERIHGYIADVLCNPVAADGLVDAIITDCEVLESSPYVGMVVRSKNGRYNGMRYIISGRYLILYKIDGDRVEVLSILDTRTKEAATFLSRDRKRDLTIHHP